MRALVFIDSTKVTRSALQNAASVSGLLLTTEAMVAEAPSDDSAGPAMPEKTYKDTLILPPFNRHKNQRQ